MAITKINADAMDLTDAYAFTGAVTGTNLTPSFEAYPSAHQTVSDTVETKVAANTERFDTDGCYDASTNYRFTPTTAGKYFVYARLSGETAGSYLNRIWSTIKRNGTTVAQAHTGHHPEYISHDSLIITTVATFNGSSDYVEFWATLDNTGGGTPKFHALDPSTTIHTYWGAFRISS